MPTFVLHGINPSPPGVAVHAWFTSRWVWCSLCTRVAGAAMPESTGRNSVGVGLRQPMMILRVSLSAVSTFFVCVLRHQTGEAYSAVLYTIIM